MSTIPAGSEGVVLHLRGGLTQEALSDPVIDQERELVTVDLPGQPGAEIPFESLKAIFFLRHPAPDMDDGGQSSQEGTRMTIEFRDGEMIRGISRDYTPERRGFFLFPLDRSKNEQIFVVQTAILSIEIEKFQIARG